MNHKLWVIMSIVIILLTNCSTNTKPTPQQYPSCGIVTPYDGQRSETGKLTCSSPSNQYIVDIEFSSHPGRGMGNITTFVIQDVENNTKYTYSDYSLDFLSWSPDEEYLIVGASYASVVTTCWTGVLEGDGSTLIYNPASWGPGELFVPLGFQNSKLVVSECHTSKCYAIDLSSLPDNFFIPGETEQVSCNKELYETDKN